MTHVIRALLWCCIVANFFVCSTGTNDPARQSSTGVGTGSETMGFVYTHDGAPAAHARIRLFDTAYVPGHAPSAAYRDSAQADSLGRYAFDSLPAGTYNLFFDKSNALSYRAGLRVAYDSLGNVLHDTLRDTLNAPGSLAGVIDLMPGDDPRKVAILVLGAGATFGSDSAGNFALTPLAAGAYRVRFLPAQDNYAVFDTTVIIRAGVNDVLPDTLRLRYTGLPAAAGLEVAYDTLRQLAALSWDRPDIARVAGFNIYRAIADSMFPATPLNATPVSDTFFVDSNGVQEAQYIYKVVSVDSAGTEAIAFAVTAPVRIATAFTLVRAIGGPGTGPGKFDKPMGLVVRDGRIYVVEQGNRRVQVLDTAGNFIREFGTRGAGMLGMPREIAWYNDSIYIADCLGACSLKVFDTAGNYARAISYEGYDITDMAIKNNDTMYIVDNDRMTVTMIDKIGMITTTSAYAFASPLKLSLDGSSLIVADAGSGKAIWLGPGLSFEKGITINSGASSTGVLATVSSVYKIAGGSLYVGVNEMQGRIYVLSPDDSLFARFTAGAPGTAAFVRDLWVVDHKIYVLTKSNTMLVYRP